MRIESERAKELQEERVKKLMEKNQDIIEKKEEKFEQKALLAECKTDRFERE